MTEDDVLVAQPPQDEEEGRPERSLAERLVEQARADGVDLVGPGGLLAGLTEQVLEAGLEVEMDEHLGYEKHAVEGRNHGNSPNGTRSKTVLTEIGPVDIEVPRDRDSSFDPQTVRKGQRRLDGVDSMVIALTAKGVNHRRGGSPPGRGVLDDDLPRDDLQDHRPGAGGAHRVADPPAGSGLSGGVHRRHLRQDPHPGNLIRTALVWL
jgi:hypothetical protein